MTRTKRWMLLALLTPVLILASGCESNQGQSAPPEASSPDAVIATVGDTPITLGEIEDAASGGLIRLRQDRYDLLRTKLESIAMTRLLETEAKSRGMSVEELRIAEVEGKVADPTPRELERAYEANKHRSRGQSFDQLRQSIFNSIRSDRLISQESYYFATLKEKYGFSVTLPAPRVELDISSDNPARGKADAPVTIVEFADFQCAFCRRAHPTVERVLNQYPDTVRYVYVDFPLSNHDRAIPAAEAAHCAGEQDKFWEYFEHAMVMAGDLNDDDLRGRAEEIGLDVSAFMSCFTSGRHAGRIDSGLQSGLKSGVDRTPTFFINGRMMTGAKNFESFKLIIDEELAAQGG